MKELLKNKLFIIISLFIILVTFISSSCFAFGDSVEINYPSELLSEDVSCIIICTNNTYIDLWIYDSSSYIESITDSNGYRHLDILMPLNPYISFYRYDFESNSFNFLRTDNYPVNTRYPMSIDNILFYNFDNPNNISVPIAETPTLVFLGAPQVIPVEVEQVTIPAIQQVEEIPQGMNQVLQVIIPIGLIVLSIGLVVYLTRLVVYRMKS